MEERRREEKEGDVGVEMSWERSVNGGVLSERQLMKLW